jgi:hypothetical protein
MPQLDLLILLQTCCENTLFFWLLYFLNIRFILYNINQSFNIRKEINNNFLFFNNVLLHNLYIKNINFLIIHILKYVINKYNYLFIFLQKNIIYWIKIVLFYYFKKINKNNIINKYIYNYYFYLSY